MTSSKENETCCSANHCKRKFDKIYDKVWSHSFPLKNELLKKWLVEKRHEHFVPTKPSRICDDHFISSDYYPSSRMLFDLPQHLQKIVTEQRCLKR